MKGLIIIPAYNEERAIREVLKKIPRKIDGIKVDVLVVNDGSTDGTQQVLRRSRVRFVSHPLNRGLGAALGTGFEFARRFKYDFVVTLDGDGQHDPKEIGKITKPVLSKKADFVVGSRIKIKGMPFYRRFLTRSASLITYVLTGVWTSDSQSGFRAFSKTAVSKIFIEVDRMEVSSYFFQKSKELGLRFVEVSVKPIYTEYSVKKGQHFSNSFNIVGKLILQRISS